MTKMEIEQVGSWIREDIFQIEVFSAFFGKGVKVNFYFRENDSKELSGFAISGLNQFLKLDNNELEKIEDEIWRHCLACNRSQASKGSRDGGKTWFDTSSTLDENLFKYNITSKDDALKLYEVVHVFIYNEPVRDIDFEINIDTPWDWGHLLMFQFKGGRFVRMEN